MRVLTHLRKRKEWMDEGKDSISFFNKSISFSSLVGIRVNYRKLTFQSNLKEICNLLVQFMLDRHDRHGDQDID